MCEWVPGREGRWVLGTTRLVGGLMGGCMHGQRSVGDLTSWVSCVIMMPSCYDVVVNEPVLWRMTRSVGVFFLAPSTWHFFCPIVTCR